MTDQTARIAAVARPESGAGGALERHLSVRIERVVGLLAPTHAGRPPEEIAADMQAKLRGLGVTISVRQLEAYARAIANLPPARPAHPAA
ncbi:hypothetical protein [Pilimelia terevasa]|nr:hypothetical protein [Pilimelia terevasa]